MICECEKPRPTPSTEDRYEMICGVLVWCSGIEYLACESCGHPLSEPTSLPSQPKELDP